MRRMPWAIYLWPGLCLLWSHGSWLGLAVAVGTAGVFDVLLLASYGWSELLGPGLRMALWAVFGVTWLGLLGWSMGRHRRESAGGTRRREEDLFATAVDCYLKGDYYQTEQILRSLLRRDPRDVDARLMLATLLRHAGRYDEAGEQLSVLTRYEAASKWELEIDEEREFLADARATKLAAAA